MRKDAESGYVLVTVASLLFVLLGFTALAIDMGTVLTSRTQLQRAADAAALAGAYAFAQNPNATESTAIDRAKSVLNSNTDLGTAIDKDSGVTVTVKCPSGCTGGTLSTANQVTVTISHTESTIFGQLLNVTGVADNVTAVAESSTSANGASCIKPWFIPNTVVDAVNDPCTAAAAGNVLFSKQGSDWKLTQYGKDHLNSQFIVKAQDPSNALSPGQYFEIDMSAWSAYGGKAAYSAAIGGCNTHQFMCMGSYGTLTGNAVGPTAQGVCSLTTGDKNCKGTADTFVSAGQYDWGDGSGIHDTSRSLVVAPIVDLNSVSGFCPSNNLPSGATVPVVGFALIFIQSADTGKDNIAVYVVSAWGCNGTTTDTSNSGSPVPLRLVRTQ